ncbi:MAG: GNAT family N-acetyltransferase [Weeksellaceae bacterium]
MQVVTQRLILRDLIETDADHMFALSADPQVTRYIDYITFKSLTDAEAWVKEKIYYNHLLPRTSYNFAIELRETAQFIGWIGIGEANDTTRGDLDFAYAIKPEYWGQRYTTEALSEVIHLGFENLHASKIFGQCDIENKASSAVMEKVGMAFETEFVEDGKTSIRYTITNI